MLRLRHCSGFDDEESVMLCTSRAVGWVDAVRSGPAAGCSRNEGMAVCRLAFIDRCSPLGRATWTKRFSVSLAIK